MAAVVTDELRISVDGIRSTRGSWMIGLYDNPESIAPAMLNIAFLVGVLALPMAGLVLAPASRTFARSGTSLAMACLLLWLLLFWSTALTLAWPLVAQLVRHIPI